MKKLGRVLSVFLILISLGLLAGCKDKETEEENVDYVSQVHLEESFTGKTFIEDGIEEVTLDQAVDGDTIHVFNKAGTILKLRFLGVDTPESTSQVEPWGMAASSFTKNIVKNCTSLVITSDGGPAAQDTYGRYMAWIWYKMDDASEYRLLNLELVQNGYSYAKNSGINNYKDELVAAANQALKLKIKVFGETDPDYCYTEAQEITLTELKTSLNTLGNESPYFNNKVIFTATVVRVNGDTYYLNDTDAETGITYGIQVYHRNAASGTGYLETVGNRVRISGTVVYYETGNVYQLTSIIDRKLTSKVDNLKLVEENYPVEAKEITADELKDTANKALLYNLVVLKNLTVKSTYTTNTDGSSSNGAITITCTVDGKTASVRTIVLVDHSGVYAVDSNNIVLASNFEGKTMDVTGIVEEYDGSYQIKLISMEDVAFH